MRQYGGNLPVALGPVRSGRAAGACCFSLFPRVDFSRVFEWLISSALLMSATVAGSEA